MKNYIFLKKLLPLIIFTFAFSTNAQLKPTWGQKLVEAPIAWQKGITGTNLTIAIIDTGIDIHHPQLIQAIYQNKAEIANGIDDDGNGLVDDIHGWNFVSNSNIVQDDSGHGTSLAGVIAGNHLIGSVLGVAPDTKILPIKFINKYGVGTIDNAINSMEYAVAQGAKIILAAWTTQQDDPKLEAKIKELSTKGILVITAAGNEANNLTHFPIYPAAYSSPNLISVGASNANDSFSTFSNYGPLIELVAPGNEILTTTPDGSEKYSSSTTLGAAFVAGAAALIWSSYPLLTNIEVATKILTSVETKNFNVATKGRLNIAKALGLK